MLSIFKHKKKIIIFAVLFILLGVGRKIYINSLNKPFTQTMRYDKNLGKAKYYSYEDGYIFKYMKTGYFSNQCFASVSTKEDAREYLDEQGNIYTHGMHIVLFYWPMDKQYGVYFIQEDPDISINEQVYVDNNMDYQPLGDSEYDNYASSLVKENKTQIISLAKAAKRKWNLK